MFVSVGLGKDTGHVATALVQNQSWVQIRMNVCNLDEEGVRLLAVSRSESLSSHLPAMVDGNP